MSLANNAGDRAHSRSDGSSQLTNSAASPLSASVFQTSVDFPA